MILGKSLDLFEPQSSHGSMLRAPCGGRAVIGQGGKAMGDEGRAEGDQLMYLP